MVRKTLLVAGFVGMILTAMAGTAFATPPAMTLSSFEATSTGGVIDGGVRTISVTNLNGETLTAHTVDLGPAPCDCVVTGDTSGTGVLVDGTWIAGDIAPGETVEITFHYGQADKGQPDAGYPDEQPAAVVAPVIPSGTPPIGTILIVGGIALILTLAVTWLMRRPRPIPIS